MSIQQERKRRANTIRWLEHYGAVEGRDWHWGTPDAWNGPAVIDLGGKVVIDDYVTPKDETALPIMIRSSGVRLIGGPLTAAAMDKGKFPDAMVFVVAPETLGTGS